MAESVFILQSFVIEIPCPHNREVIHIPVNIAERSALIEGVALSLPVAVELSIALAPSFQNFH